MRILVLSDSHRDSFSLKEAIDAQPGAKTVFFLGDGLAELDSLIPQYPGKTFFSVRGNCDWGSAAQETGLVTVDQTPILYTHGHNYHVKYSLYDLKSAARTAGARVLLYGCLLYTSSWGRWRSVEAPVMRWRSSNSTASI